MLNRSNITDEDRRADHLPIHGARCQLQADRRCGRRHLAVRRGGVYSAYASQNTAGQLWLRGFQITDAHGQATFTSIFPGWYSGRLTHLHGKVFLNGVQKDTTNFFFPKSGGDRCLQ